MRYGHSLGGWRCRLNLSMFSLTISVGRFWSVQSVLEFNAIKKNLRIMSDIERVFWTVLFRMASRVFLFFIPSDSSLVRDWFVCSEPRTPVVKLVWEAFQPLFSRWLRWLMKPSREQYLSFFSCSFLSAQSAFVSMALVCSRNTHSSSFMSKARPSGLRVIKLSTSAPSNSMAQGGVVFFDIFPKFGPYSFPTLLGESHVAPCVPGSYINPIPHELLDWELKETATGVPMRCWVQ